MDSVSYRVRDLCVAADGARSQRRDGRIIDELVRIHVAAFPGFFLTRMGPRFIRTYYRCVLAHDRAILVVAEDENGIVGFAAGFLDSQKFYRSMRLRILHFAFPAMAAVYADPKIVVQIFQGFLRTGRYSRVTSEATRVCELTSLAVDPARESRGVGRALVAEFCRRAGILGAECVELTTDAPENDRVNRFYQSVGFGLTATAARDDGRVMNHYARRISSDRGEAVQ
jgi:ribosomal protein S18 acetylase RimI-like enzyme